MPKESVGGMKRYTLFHGKSNCIFFTSYNRHLPYFLVCYLFPPSGGEGTREYSLVILNEIPE
jgi:hypothetical protein